MARYLAYDDNGDLIYPASISESAGAADADKLLSTDPVTGLVDESVLPPGYGRELGMYVALEDMSAGKFVQRILSEAASKVRLADKTGKAADGYILTSVSMGEQVKVYALGQRNNAVSGLTIGEYYFLGAAGGVVLGSALTFAIGDVIQKLGKAVEANVIETQAYEAATVS